MSDTLAISEIYLSLQGESTWSGLPCVFVRLAACNLRCAYCDTAYALTGERTLSVEGVGAEVDRLAAAWAHLPSRPRLPLVELTGGEPLMQPGALPLMSRLCDAGFTVLLETNGALDIAPVDARVHRIMDLKCPSSGEVDHNRWDNLVHLRATDEIKFVIGTCEDYDWMREQIVRHRLAAICPLLVSWVTPLTPAQRHPTLKPAPAGHTPLTRQQLAARILRDAVPVRFQLQLHKVIWPSDPRGV